MVGSGVEQADGLHGEIGARCFQPRGQHAHAAVVGQGAALPFACSFGIEAQAAAGFDLFGGGDKRRRYAVGGYAVAFAVFVAHHGDAVKQQPQQRVAHELHGHQRGYAAQYVCRHRAVGRAAAVADDKQHGFAATGRAGNGNAVVAAGK